MIFSFSRLVLFECCMYRGYNKYILGKEEQMTTPLAIGKAVHTGVEAKLNGKVETNEEAAYFGAVEVDFFDGVTFEEIVKLISRVPSYYLQLSAQRTEVHFQLPLSQENNSPIVQGYIDVLQPGLGCNELQPGGSAEIVDWKTNWKMDPNRHMKQLALYAWATEKITGVESVLATVYYLRFKKPISINIPAEKRYEAAQWALKLAEEILTRVEMIKLQPENVKAIFPAKPSKDCRHCPLAAECVVKFALHAK
ncbi:PD-(D/E)XK nuclease family protein [Paenibacillus sp. LjRoot153]|uniref:PD-(D/E)XK nuclease family protein n=1 Tax=Paenibacillus sp. LjRoot153 TaxID=3342270 RepID=UPI003ECDC812